MWKSCTLPYFFDGCLIWQPTLELFDYRDHQIWKEIKEKHFFFLVHEWPIQIYAAGFCPSHPHNLYKG